MTTEQKIEQAAQDFASELCDGPQEYSPLIQGFTAGATYFQSELLPGELEALVDWLWKNYYPDTMGGQWCKKYGGKMIAYTTAQLVQEYLKQRNP